MKKYSFLLLLFFLSTIASFAQNCNAQFVAVPNFTSNQVTLYYQNGAVYKTINVPTALASPPAGTALGINAVVIINSHLFVGLANNGGTDFGRILHYTAAQVQNNQNPTPLATPNNQAVIALSKDAASNLFVSTAAAGNNSGVIARYTAASNYAASSLQSLPITADMGWWVNAFGGIAVYDAQTLFTTDVFGNAIICYHNIDWGVSPASAQVTVLRDVAVAAPYLFSLPEGVALDANNDLWVSSNNDTYSTHLNATGNLVHLTQSMWQNHIASGNPPVITIDASLLGVENVDIWENGVNPTMLGGIAANGTCLYVNNQKNGATSKVLEYVSSNHIVSNTSYNQTYPGFGGISLYTNTPFDPTFTAISPNETSIEHFSAYPNPTEESLQIEWNMSEIKPITIRIFDMLGKEVIAPQNVTNTKMELNIHSLPAGIYTITLQAEGDAMVNEKIVKQ